uniref:FAD6 n=1 Tax=Arundo donax TaxID=35708 RepID=A0A0A9EJN6_ARUDO
MTSMCMSHTIFLQEYQVITFALPMTPSNRTGASMSMRPTGIGD